MVKNIMIVGVGGQGALLAPHIPEPEKNATAGTCERDQRYKPGGHRLPSLLLLAGIVFL